MKISENTHHDVIYECEDYVRWSSYNWSKWYGDSLEFVFGDMELKLEAEFQKNLGVLSV